MNNFRNAINAAHGESHDHDDIADNFRDVQPLNGRTVKRNFVGEVHRLSLTWKLPCERPLLNFLNRQVE